MTTPSDTQSLILSRAATRPGNLALPLPEGLVGAAAKMVVGKMIARGWLEEVEANLRRGEPMWRETGDGHGTTLIATEAGLEAIGIEPLVASAVASTRKANPEPTQTRDDADTAKPGTIRTGTKQAQIIAMLQRPEGAISAVPRCPSTLADCTLPSTSRTADWRCASSTLAPCKRDRSTASGARLRRST